MALRFRTFFPYTLPGVLAVIGWWWYITRKKERTNKEKQAITGAGEQGTKAFNTNCGPVEAVSSVNTVSPQLHQGERAEEENKEIMSLVDLMSAPLPVETLGRLDARTTNFCSTAANLNTSTFEGGAEKLVLETLTSQGATFLSNEEMSRMPLLHKVNEQSSVMEPETVCGVDKVQPVEHSVVKSSVVSTVDLAVEPLAKGDRSTELDLQVAFSSETAGFQKRAQEPESDKRFPAEEEEASIQTPSSVELGSLESSANVRASDIQAAVVYPCLGKEEGREDTELTENNLQENFAENDKIQQVAACIISEVISAATQEVLSSTTDVSEQQTSCVILEDQVNSLLESKDLNISHTETSESQDEGIIASTEKTTPLKCCVPIPTQLEECKKQNQSEDCVVERSSLVNGCSSQAFELCLKECIPDVSMQSRLQEASKCPVEELRKAEKTCAVVEDSGCSTCLSGDGTGVEDQLQSTALSCVLADQKSDVLNLSVIEESSSTLHHAAEITQALEGQEMQKSTYSSEILESNSVNARNGGPWSTETEADHSGASDVNSMDSVDSGCALGGAESHQNAGLLSQSDKTELTVWEIEVPKHLVGRLIGKQGRYVSFLKQTSGAKIYISTLPYTQEFQICHLEGTHQQVDKALNLIAKKFKELDLTNIYAPPPPPLSLPSLPITSWLMLPDGITVEVIIVNVVNAGHMFVQQHTHPTYHALRSLDQQMYLCYSSPGIPTLPSPVEVGVICAAPAVDGAWWRAQIVDYFKETNEAEVRYVDYGGYERVKIEVLRQIRSDFVTLPFQGAEVLLDNVIPLPGEERFSSEADAALDEMTRGSALLAQVTSYDSASGLPLIQLWNMMGEEVVSINRALVERGLAQWVDNY
uniref:A-kinase anchoring protein 1 n=1 Tax=Latimeria chalumnae TaxID=7897 RepID=H3BBA0_LATCH